MKHLLLMIIFFVQWMFYSFAQNISWEQPQKVRLTKMADSLSKHLKPWKVPKRVFKVEKYGAIGDSSHLNTLEIQHAINDCSKNGGGIVLFSQGQYVTGTIELKSGVMLEIKKNCKILGSVHIADYPERIESFKSVMSENHKYRQSLIYAENSTNVGIRGDGEIYFRGEKVYFPGKETIGEIVDRPFGIRMISCKNIVLQNIFLHNSASWMQSYLYCQNLIFDGIRVINQANYNNDGLDPDGCTNLIVRNCYINSEDDAMCLKGASNMPSKNILIENSTFLSSCNALKIGTDTQGDFYNIVARNLTLGGIPNDMHAPKGHDASTGVTLATVDGGNVHDILVSNIKINMTRCPIFLRIGKRLRAMPNSEIKDIGQLHKIIIEDVTGENNFKQGSLISGIKNHSINDVIIKNYKIIMSGGGDSSLLNNEVPEKENGYPDAQSFLKQGLPSFGFYVRYAEKIHIDNAEIIPIKNDARPEVIAGKDVIDFYFNKNKITQQHYETLTINNGNFDEYVEWKDNHGQLINAHDGGVIFTNGKYYWYGLALRPLGRDTLENNGAATTTGINLYSSNNLNNWIYEGVILPTSTDKNNLLRSPMRMERPKIIYNHKTKKYVMWFHYVGYPGNHKQNIGYADAGIAVADKITGPFKFLGYTRPINDSGAVKDCSLFVDDDSSAYFIYDRKLPNGSRCLHIVKLSDDYLHATDQWTKIDIASRREAPAIIKQDGIYYLVTSDVSGWKSNAAKTYKTNNLFGTWTDIGNPCVGDQKETTYNTQCTYAFKVHGKKNLSVIMLERHNTNNFLKCSYVWLPIVISNNQELNFPYLKTWGLSGDDIFIKD